MFIFRCFFLSIHVNVMTLYGITRGKSFAFQAAETFVNDCF